MSNKNQLKPIAMALGTAFAASLAGSSVASANQNPFSMTELSSGYMVADNHEGKCGAMKGEAEGKCGAQNKAQKEGQCGGQKSAGEGKCGAAKKVVKEGKCGEGKCGAGMKSE